MLIQFIANVLGVAEDNVVYHPHQIGGSFGDKMADAMGVMGVIMTREDQFNLRVLKSISLHKMKAGISNKASLLSERITAVEHDVAGRWVRKRSCFDNNDDRTPAAIHDYWGRSTTWGRCCMI